MADVPITKSERESRSQELESSRPAPQQIGTRGMASGGPALFSLSPREFFTANPFELMRRFTEDMDRLFEGTSPAWSQSAMALWAPAIEVSETKGQFKVCAELPGLSKEDVRVELTQDGVTISGERKREAEDRRQGVYRSERRYGAFRRTIPIPEGANLDETTATFENGILTVTVSVPQANRQRREIPIETGGSATSKGA